MIKIVKERKLEFPVPQVTYHSHYMKYFYIIVGLKSGKSAIIWGIPHKIQQCVKVRIAMLNYAKLTFLLFHFWHFFGSSLCHMIESVVWQKERKRWRLASIFCRKKKRNNGFTWMVDQISGEEEAEEGKKKNELFSCAVLGPEKVQRQWGKRNQTWKDISLSSSLSWCGIQHFLQRCTL